MFEPINKAHAIAEMVVFFEFTPDLGAVMPSLMGVKETLKERLPKQEEVRAYAVELIGDSGKMNPLPAGLKLSRFRADGQPEWLVQIGGPSISIHCLDYSRWSDVWSEVRFYIAEIFSEIGAAQIGISAIGLKYIDRFLWSGKPEEYTAQSLLASNTDLLHGKAFNSGSRWHCHTGWFDDALEGQEVLNQLNIDSGIGIANGRQTIILTVDHTQALRRQGSNSISHFLDDPVSDDGPLSEMMAMLHKKNKNVLLSLLVADMAKRINLRGAEQ